MLIVKQHPLRNCIFKSVAFELYENLFYIFLSKNNEVINFIITKKNSVHWYILFLCQFIHTRIKIYKNLP